MNQDKIKEFSKEFDISDKLSEEILKICEDKNLNEIVIKGKITEIIAEYNNKKEKEEIDEGLTPFVRREFFKYIDSLDNEYSNYDQIDDEKSYYKKVSQKIDKWGNDLLSNIEKRGKGNIFNFFLPASIILFILILILLFFTNGFNQKSGTVYTSPSVNQKSALTEDSIECYKNILEFTKDMEPQNIFLSSAIIQREGACNALEIIEELFQNESKESDK